MAVFKCKMCGGALEINAGNSVAVCEYCNTKQTLPKLDDDKRAQLYDRANYFRRENEFDKAMGIYEMILSEDKEDCESYWGIVLCRYGIEYVEDPRSHKRIPTVNRAQFTSIFEDEDYKNAINYADALQKEVYEAEASVIDKIQKGILAISQKEEPFDVFICYKETDSFGNRTQDSVYAQDIYNALTKEGYKVFFSRITLEDKLGSAYEPYIFAALNSAKVMLVVGTSKENFEAVWVKNEWSRFVSLIKSGKEKTLIPVYKDISPYDMPEEFQFLQAQDMSKIGFMQDLVRGVSKLLGADKPVIKERIVVNQGNAQIAPLLERATMFLEDGDFDRADDFYEQVLNLDPKNAQAYLGKLMIECNVCKFEDLEKCEDSFEENTNYQKVIRFCDDAIKEQLTGYLFSINARIEQENLQKIQKTRDEYRAEQLQISREKKVIACVLLLFLIVVAGLSVVSVFSYPGYAFEQGDKILLKSDGTIIATGKYVNNSKYDVTGWTNISSISEGYDHVVGLKSDGTVVAVGSNIYGQCDVDDWTDVIAISAGSSHTVGLKSDGTVVATGDNIYGQCDVSDWKDIVAISVGSGCTIGLKSDGTVVAVGDNDNSQCDVSDWSDIVEISADSAFTIGLKSNGTVVVAGYDFSGHPCDVRDWSDIVSVSTNEENLVGLKSDGTIVMFGHVPGGYNLSQWTNVVDVFVGDESVSALNSDGTIMFAGALNGKIFKYKTNEYKNEDIVSIIIG